MTTRRFPKRPPPPTPPSPAPAAESLVARVDQQRPGETPGDTIPTGFPSIDRMLGGGLRRRDLVVLGGDIGAGKSALAPMRSEEHTSGLHSPAYLVCPLLL